jgi:hypothetical protein
VRFENAQSIESLCYQLKTAEFPRAQNRALVNRLFNGFRPFTEEEVQDNDINVNFNDLTGTRKAHDARGQMYSAILKSGNYFKATASIGPKADRAQHSETVTRLVNRTMKRSLKYYELQRAKIAQSILHGIGISAWPNGDAWCPRSISIEDMLIPSGEASELPMTDLPLFAIHKSLTAPQLAKLTRGPNVDEGWNMPVVEACIKWVDEQTSKLLSNNWPVNWSPEKYEERRKEGDYFGDAVPTIEVYDFFYWDDDGKESGWKRRMILDAWGTPQSVGGQVQLTRKTGDLYGTDRTFDYLYNPGERIYARNMGELASFQFSDLSAVAPFRYHAVRGLGFLLHDALHIQNRLTCKLTESTFETLTMLMRVKSQEDVQRALKANLFNRGFVDETVQFIPANERWQPNPTMIEFGANRIREVIDESSSTHSQNRDMSKGVEKGQLQIMAELNATTAMLSAGLLQYYQYQENEYREVFRRFLNSDPAGRDIDVKSFRAAALRDGVPEEMLNNPDGWEVEAERVMGAGNKTFEMAIAQQLLQMRPLYDQDAQRQILRDVTLAITDDPARADSLVPEEPRVSDTVHDTELAFGTLMMGNPVTPKSGLNGAEVAATIIREMTRKVGEIMKTGGVGTAQDIHGLTMAAGYAGHFVQDLEKDKTQAKTVEQLKSSIGKLGNFIKAFAQRQAEQAKKAAQSNGNGAGAVDPKELAKAKAIIMQAQTKNQIAKETHADRTAQRQIAFEQKLKEQKAKHELDVHKAVVEHGATIHKADLETAANVRRGGMKSFGGDEE